MPTAGTKTQAAVVKKSAAQEEKAKSNAFDTEPVNGKATQDSQEHEAATKPEVDAADTQEPGECEEQRRARKHLELVNDRYIARMLVTVDPVQDWDNWCAWFEQAKDDFYTVAELALMARTFGAWFGTKEDIKVEKVIDRYMSTLFRAAPKE